MRCGSNRHLRFDRWVVLIFLELRKAIEKRTRRFATLGARHDLAVARDRIVDAAELGVEPKGRCGIRLALQLLARRVDVIAIDVRIGEDVHELVRLELYLARDEMEK